MKSPVIIPIHSVRFTTVQFNPPSEENIIGGISKLKRSYIFFSTFHHFQKLSIKLVDFVLFSVVAAKQIVYFLFFTFSPRKASGSASFFSFGILKQKLLYPIIVINLHMSILKLKILYPIIVFNLHEHPEIKDTISYHCVQPSCAS